MANNKPSFLSRLKFLMHPIAMGLYITLIFSWTSFRYYQEREDIESSSILYKVINDIDKISIDYRLRLRGPRPGSPDVAILAFDDRSLGIIGRWPWPRQTTSQVFKNSFDAGAKMIAADIVWSEPTDRPEQHLVDKLKSEVQLPNSATELLDQELDKLDSDAQFAKQLEEYKDNFVLGTFYNQSSKSRFSTSLLGLGFVEYCERIVFDRSIAGEVWNNDHLPLAVLDSNSTEIPDVIKSQYQEYFSMIEQEELASLGENPGYLQLYDVRSRIYENQLGFCNSDFLSAEKDPILEVLAGAWSQVLEADPYIQEGSAYEWANNFKSSTLTNQVYNPLVWTINIPGLSKVAKYNGFFSAIQDSDGTIRNTQLFARTGSYHMPSIALKGFLIANNYSAQINIDPNDTIIGAKGVTDLVINDNNTGDAVFNIPVKRDGSILINYAGPQRMFPYVSAAELVDPNNQEVVISYRYYDKATDKWLLKETERVDKKTWMKDKMLIAGSTAIGVYDLRVTPFEENYPGVETHANVLDNLIRRDFLKAQLQEPIYMPLIILALGIIISIALAQLGAVSGLIFTLFLIGGIAFAERTFFFLEGYVTSIVFPISLIAGSYVFMTFYKYFTEERSKKELRQTFSKYVSPSIVAEVLQDPKNLELGGRKEEITVFFSDVAGFTTISEQLDPKALSDLLNDYLTPMTELVFEHKGTLDKYIGDAVMAFFGAPIHYDDHAKCAARCALAQLEKLTELQKEYAKKGLPLIDIRIGLNTGECSVGNMGSETVRNYTVMGDAVNLASRLEAINKYYGTRIMISEFTHEAIKDEFICREVDKVRVKGKLLPVKIFELMAEGQASDSLDKMKKYFDDGYSLYHEKRFEAAIQAFESALDANPDDSTSKIYIERCQTYMTTPPEQDWDGVFVMTSK